LRAFSAAQVVCLLAMESPTINKRDSGATKGSKAEAYLDDVGKDREWR
jgi:hypothetical protein